MTRIVRAGDRYRSAHGGVVSWHCFAAGAHYEPDNVGFGALLGCDEHLLEPGAGFDWHGHRGVDIVSWVLSGALRHEDSRGPVRILGPGQALVQSTGAGIRHREDNASAVEPLRMVQTTVLGGADEPTARLAMPPLQLSSGQIRVWTGDDSGSAASWHAFVAAGSWLVEPASLESVPLSPGDSARGTGQLTARGSGQLLVWLA